MKLRVLVPAVLAVASLAAGGAWLLTNGDDPDPGTTAALATTTSITTTTTTTTSTTTSTTTTTTTTTTIPIVPVGTPDEPAPEPPAPEPAIRPGFSGTGVVTIAAGGADVATEPGGDVFVRAREGLVFPATGRSGDWVEIFTTCDEVAWVRASEIAAAPPAAPDEIGPGFDFSQAVIVLDPGHGGPRNIGAVGAGDLAEKVVNLDIARRARDLFAESHVVDWERGTIFTGSEIPAAGAVLLTRVGAGEAGDYEAGLEYRAALANAAGAHVLVSVHNNAGWEIDLEVPGSDVFYQSQDPVAIESRRLAVLLVEELRRSFEPFEARWVGASFAGAKSRLSPRDGESQYYGVLRRAEVPSVIAEGAYLGNPSEAALLATPRFRQAYAEAIYRAVVRFLTTDDPGGADSSDPEVWPGFAGSGAPGAACEIPAQPELAEVEG